MNMPLDVFQSIRRDGSDAVARVATLDTVDLQDETGQSLLHSAIAYSNMPAVLYLLGRDVNVNIQDAKGVTPLHLAGAYRNPEIASLLLEHGAELSLVDQHGNSAIWTAAFNARGQHDVVKVLMARGGREYADLKNIHGRSPLDFARQIGDMRLVNLLERV